MADYPQVYCHISRKINLGNYESAEVTIGLSGVPSGSTPEAIAEMLGTAKFAFDACRKELHQKITDARASQGYEDPEPCNTQAYAEAFG